MTARYIDKRDRYKFAAPWDFNSTARSDNAAPNRESKQELTIREPRPDFRTTTSENPASVDNNLPEKVGSYRND